MTTTNAETEETSALLRLPGELRNNIYSCVVGTHKTYLYTSAAPRGPCRPDLRLTLVCQALSTEVLSFFYGNNSFKLYFRGEDVFASGLHRAQEPPKIPQQLADIPAIIVKNTHRLEIRYEVLVRTYSDHRMHLATAYIIAEGDTFDCRYDLSDCKGRDCEKCMGRVAVEMRRDLLKVFGEKGDRAETIWEAGKCWS